MAQRPERMTFPQRAGCRIAAAWSQPAASGAQAAKVWTLQSRLVRGAREYRQTQADPLAWMAPVGSEEPLALEERL